MNKYNYNTRAVLMLLLTISCSLCTAQINGTGQIATRSYPLAPFTKLSINTPAEVIVDVGAEESRLEITGDENVLRYLPV